MQPHIAIAMSSLLAAVLLAVRNAPVEVMMAVVADLISEGIPR
jgi:hypothetical protein